MVNAERADLLDRYRQLNELASGLASTLELSSLLNRIVHSAADLCRAEAASILLYDENTSKLYFQASSNLEEPVMDQIVVPLESIAGWIVTNRQPVLIANAQQDARHYSRITDSTSVVTETLLGVPMIAKGKVIGVLEVINKRQGEFDNQDQDIMMALGAQAAIAIENARLFEQSDQISELVHELRTPLTSLNTAAKLILDERLPEKSRRDLVNLMVDEIRRLSEMTTDFLDLSQLETGRAHYHKTSIEIVPLVEEALQLVRARAQENNQEIIFDPPEALPLVKADRRKIKQVLLNLLTNAIKYNRPGGQVVVAAKQHGSEIEFRVSDNGPGIPPEYVPHLFEKFFRVPTQEVSIQGTGLGLSICRRIIDDHSGQISAHSQLGAGTTITFTMPVDGG